MSGAISELPEQEVLSGVLIPQELSPLFNLFEKPEMKKSLIALAVLATTGAAMAQSSVTLNGRVDAALYSLTTGVGAAEVTQTGIGNGGDFGLTGSRWALNGTEDLGGGLKALFLIETGFNADTGTGRVTSGLGDHQT